MEEKIIVLRRMKLLIFYGYNIYLGDFNITVKYKALKDNFVKITDILNSPSKRNSITILENMLKKCGEKYPDGKETFKEIYDRICNTGYYVGELIDINLDKNTCISIRVKEICIEEDVQYYTFLSIQYVIINGTAVELSNVLI